MTTTPTPTSRRGARRDHTGRCTRYVALHPLCGAAPLTWRCTRSERVHCLHIGCIAYGSGAPPTPTSPNTDMRTSPRAGSAPHTTATHYLDSHCATYSPAQRPPSSATLPLTSPTAARVATTQGTTSITGHCTRYVALHLLRGATPVMWRCTRYRALHPLCGAAPLTWRCTRSERVHCLHIGCSAHTNKPKRGYAHLPHRQCTTHHCDALLGQTLRYLLASATPPIKRNTPPHKPNRSARRNHTGHHIHNRALHPLRSAAPLTWRCTRSERVHCLHIGCIAHTHKPNRGEHPAARSLRPATVRTFTNSARNSLTATRNNTPETAGFQRSDFKS